MPQSSLEQAIHRLRQSWQSRHGLGMQGLEKGEESVGGEFLGTDVPGDPMDGVGRGEGGRCRPAGQIIPEHLAAFSEGGPEK